MPWTRTGGGGDNRRVRVLGVLALTAALAAGSADAARLPGLQTPTRNIHCLWVPLGATPGAPVTPATRGVLHCAIARASYATAEQARCRRLAGLDWHGFELPWNHRRASPVCSGGALAVGHDTPTFRVLAYGNTWRYRGFTCTSRITGLTCTNRRGHGLFLSRASYRLW